MARPSIFVCVVIVMTQCATLGNGNPVFNINPEINLSSSGGTEGTSCDVLGTASSPAFSCMHLKSACNKPNGEYFIMAAGIYTKVMCEMVLHGGGWARYGHSGKQDVWNYVDEDAIEVTLEIMNASTIKQMIDLKYSLFVVDTDVTFKMQGDDSVNPSRLTIRTLPFMNHTDVYIDGFANDHTRLEFTPGSVDRMTCIPGSTSKCGLGGTPEADKDTKPFLFETLQFGPRATGASATGDQWFRNKYTWSGSYYHVYAK